MESVIKVIERKDIREFDKAMGLNAFFKTHGTFKLPNCYVCSKKKSDRYVKVEQLSIDYEPETEYLVFKCKCHGDEQHLRKKLDEVLNTDKIDLRMVFKPGQGYRENGRIVYTIPRKHKLDTTQAY